MSPLRHILIWTATLFALWMTLSGEFDGFHLGVGLASAIGVAVITRPLLCLPPALGAEAGGLPLRRFLLYLPWLLREIVVAAVQVAWVVLQPRMPIAPRLVRFKAPLPHTLARLTLANSITLTPGTVTLDVDGDDFVIHALTEASAHSLEPGGVEGEMQRRVRAVFVGAGGGQR